MRATAALAAVSAASIAVLAGCTPTIPVPVTAGPPQEAAAVTQSQIDRIVPATFEELAAADADREALLLEDRVGSPASRIRLAQYRQANAGDEAAIEEIPAQMQAVYVSGETTWPRVMVGVTAQPEDATPVVALWVQQSVDTGYQMLNWGHMIPGATLPSMPGPATGAMQLPVDSDALATSPEQVVNDYLELLRQGPDSDLDAQFEPDTYRERLFDVREVLTETAEKGEGKYVDTIQPRIDDTFVLETADAGALVLAPITIASAIAVEGGASLELPDQYAPLVDGDIDDTATLHYLDFLVIHIPADPEALPAVVAADHHLIRVTAE